MEDMAVARINGGMISWALRRSGASLESLASKNVSVDKLIAWEAGVEFPSEGQAEALADKLGIAYPMLFIRNTPADEPIKVPDRRTVDGRALLKPSLGLLEVLDSTRARQTWFRREMEHSGLHPLSFVASFSMSDSPSTVAANMREVLEMESLRPSESSDYESFLKALVVKAESIGILVMRSAVVGHASRRTLDEKEFRGFALPDTLAPVVFINDHDAKAAQIFTFAHEIAHVWLGASGVSDRSPDEVGDSRNLVETFCDAVAAEFLVPEQDLRHQWKTSSSVEANMFGASKRFNVSTLVILRRAKALDLINPQTFLAQVTEQYEGYKRHEKEKLRKLSKQEGKRKKGGNFWNSFEIRNGRTFNATVVRAIRERRTTYAEAGTLFGINPGAASRYVQKTSSR